MNILQQTAGSIGTATMSVVLTGQVLASPAATAYNAVAQGAVPVSRVPAPVLAAGRSALAGAFGHTFLVALVLIVCCLVPAFFMPRRKVVRDAAPGEQTASAEAGSAEDPIVGA
jgi:hypothetical protein